MSINKNLLIYIVEDNEVYNRKVVELLKKQGFKKVKSFLNGKDCVSAVKKGESPDIVIQDYFLEDLNGLDVLKSVKKLNKNSEFVFLTGNENMEVAVNSIKYGAFDYIIKDDDLALKKMLNKIEKISKMIELQRRNDVIRKAMIISLVILVAIVIITFLYTFFNTFGLQK